jgi:glycosyltransferase involved in cell wall biosynthesis
MIKKKVVFVCHYFPPQNNVGIRRVTFWVNYFARNGYEVTVITSKKKNSGLLFDLVHKTVKVIEYGFFTTKLVARTSCGSLGGDNGQTQQAASKVTPLIFIKRKLINPIFGQLADYRIISVVGFVLQFMSGKNQKLVDNYVSQHCTIISTAPPWPVHLLAMFLKLKYKAKHIVDYRDPFSNNHMFSSIFSTIENFIDKIICSSADAVTTVSPSWVSLYNNKAKKIKLIRNGYDAEMFYLHSPSNFKQHSNAINLNYFGTIEHQSRFPKEFIDFLNSTNLNVKVNFYGKCPLIYDYIQDNPHLKSKVSLMGHKSYNETIEIMKTSDFNLVCEAIESTGLSQKGLIPTKVYEYIACGKPIVALMDKDSDAINLISKSGLLAHDLNSLDSLPNLFSNLGTHYFQPNSNFDSQLFSRQYQAQELIELIEESHKNDL